MKNEKMIISTPPPRFVSSKRLCRFLCAVFCTLFAFALVGCGDKQPPDTQTGTFQKSYDLYEPVKEIENIKCDLYYNFLSPSGKKSTYYIHGNSPRLVDKWRIYELEERENGAFNFAFTAELKDRYKSETGHLSEYMYNKTATCNYGDLSDEQLDYFLAYKSSDTEGNIYEDYPSYYSTYIVDNHTTEWEIAYGNVMHLCRIWSIRLYVLFENGSNRITLHEYFITTKYIVNSETDPPCGLEDIFIEKFPT